MALLALGMIISIVYSYFFSWQSNKQGFALDNRFILLEDPRLHDANRNNIKLIFTQDYWWPKAISGLYRPLTTLSYLFNYAVLENAGRASGYVAFNFLLHWFNAFMVYLLVLILIKNFWPAWCPAALFGVHPIATESVANIIGRADLFAALAVLIGFLLYARSTVAQGWRKIPWLVALTLISGIGVFFKENVIVLLGVMVLYDFTFRIEKKHSNGLINLIKNSWGFVLKGYIAVIPSFAAWWFVRHRVFKMLRPPELPFVDNPLPYTEFWTGELTAIKVIGKYLYLLLWPKSLSCDYSINQIPLVNWQFSHWEDWKALIALITVIVIISISIRHYHRNKPIFFFIMFFFITFLPTSNLIIKIGSIMAERFMYLPLIGYSGCLVLVCYAVCRRSVLRLGVPEWRQKFCSKALARSALGLIMIAYGTRTIFRSQDWENDVTLWTQAVKACPNSFKTHKSLAYALFENDPQRKEIDKVIEEGEKSLAITDKTSIVMLHLGVYYRTKGDTLAHRTADGTLIPTTESFMWYQKSIDTLKSAIPVDMAYNEDNRQKELRRGRSADQIPDIGNHEIYENLGSTFMRVSKFPQAIEAYHYMRHLTPTDPNAYLILASAYLSTGQNEKAAIAFLQTLLLDPNRQQAVNLLVDIYGQIDPEDCAIDLQQNVPRINMDCTIVRNHICSAFADLVQSFFNAKQHMVAEQTKLNAINKWQCPGELFAQIRPKSPAKLSFAQ